MGLTHTSTGHRATNDGVLDVRLKYTVALAGNPNVGKSSIFNALTGLKQHTGNWTGKTVATAVGHADRENITFVDLPGTYSLRAHSPEEEVARDFIKSGTADAVVVVCDALCLERSLALALQIIELTEKVIVCVNFMDEAARRGVSVDTTRLSKLLGVPAIAVSARKGDGLERLCEEIRSMADSPCKAASPLTYPPETEAELSRLVSLGFSRAEVIEGWLSEGMPKELADSMEKCSDGSHERFNEMLLSRPIIIAEGIACEVVKHTKRGDGCVSCGYSERDRRIDRIVTHPLLSLPLMLLMLAGIFWLTIVGSNYPSAALQSLFDMIEAWLYDAAAVLPDTLREVLISGMLRTLFRVVAVMLPPMAIFFPLFTLMEDLGLLGRIAFNLDGALARVSACGKQALTMCMGLGCNAAGVVGCRIIDSPRERMIAILTNNFMPCNGRFPILITMSALLCAGSFGGIAGALIMTLAIVAGTLATLTVSKLLSLTLFRGVPSSFTLELPPYRRPQIGRVIVRSVFDRTLFVLGRAAAVAVPAGLIIWLLANITVGDATLLAHISMFLDPLGRLIGLDGVILCAFILGFPANEIVLPLIIMCYTASGTLGSDTGLSAILAANGWTSLTYINMMIMTLFHFPCSTTVLTVKKETGSTKMAALSMVIPTALGVALCAVVTAISQTW